MGERERERERETEREREREREHVVLMPVSITGKSLDPCPQPSSTA
jgi:hypothetical protein